LINVHAHIHLAVVGESVVNALLTTRTKNSYLLVTFPKKLRRHMIEVLKTIFELRSQLKIKN
jgi:hypothetical protein